MDNTIQYLPFFIIYYTLHSAADNLSVICWLTVGQPTDSQLFFFLEGALDTSIKWTWTLKEIVFG